MKNTTWYALIVTALLLMSLLSCKSANPTIAEGTEIKLSQQIMPLLTKKNNVLAFYEISNPTATIANVTLSLSADKKLSDISQISIYRGETNEFAKSTRIGFSEKISKTTVVPITENTDGGFLWIVAKTNDNPDLLNKIYVRAISLFNKNNQQYPTLGSLTAEGFRFGLTLRERHQDDVDTYRIPGLATTNNGTLIAVYDNRYNNAKDLQGHIDVGMSRSTDGGQTWQPMKVIMDMGEWGGKPQDKNGIGDPAVLVDKQTNTVWVAALWHHGSDSSQMIWWASKPGMSPEETGQFVLVKSEDDGLTWSEPINITDQVKNPQWYLFFNGPGSGISLQDGKIVFAAQYKDHEQVPYSTLIYSDDHGKTWNTGVGAKSHTTEAQVAELSDGTLMLNMRDDRNRKNNQLSDDKNGRSVAVTTDFGNTWTEHHTSRSALAEPNCMASIIAVNHPKYGHLLFFSNPNSDRHRNHMTIKVSKDDGNTWSKGVEIYEQHGYGYSCLTQVDENTVGILYEGAGDLYFQKIAIEDLMR